MGVRIISYFRLWVVLAYLFARQVISTEHTEGAPMQMLRDRKGSASGLIATATVGSQAECAVLCAAVDARVAVNIRVEPWNGICELLSHSCGIKVEIGWTLIKQLEGTVLYSGFFEIYFNA